MEKMLTNKTVSLTEMRDPAKVLANAGNTPVAVLNRNKVVGYFVPNAAVNQTDFEMADTARMQNATNASIKRNQTQSTYIELFTGQISMILLSATDVLAIHEKVIHTNERQGFAGNKSLDAIVA